MSLTKKQDIFSTEVIKQNTLSDAYRTAYDTKNMTDKQINEEASKLMKNPKIAQRVTALKNEIEKKEIYTLERSIKRDLKLIERYEAALDVLEDLKSKDKDVEAAERTIKYIGAHGYNSAQERVSKQHGWFKADNNQKNIPIRQVVNMSDYKKK